MSCSVYVGWGLLIPAIFSYLYGFAACHAMEFLGYQQRQTVWERIRIALPAMLLFVCWGIVNIPLPVVYILAFSGKLLRLLHKKENRSKELFLVSFTHLVTMAFHMILIGVISLAASIPLHELLRDPRWRIATIAAVLGVDNIIVFILPRNGTLHSVLRTQLDSEEVKPFTVFLWFCNVFLLLDSLLCISEINWDMLPLFLIGSTVLMEFYLVRFLCHLYTVLKVRYLENEHRRLVEKLRQQNITAKALRSKSELDHLTGIYSRRYAMEHMEAFLRAKESFSLAYIDLDHLKEINDKKGHQAGDDYLVRFARELGASLRETDIFARMGGDEFIVLLPGCGSETAANRMGEIRSRLAGDNGQPLSFSFGVIHVPADSGCTAEQALYRADQAMYRDKKARNQ